METANLGRWRTKWARGLREKWPLLAVAILAGIGNAAALPESQHIEDDVMAQETALLLAPENDTPAKPRTPKTVDRTTRHRLGEWLPKITWPHHVPTTAAHLPDGRILTFASNSRVSFWDGGIEFAYAGTWNPKTNEFKEFNHPTHDIFCGGTALLPDGRLHITGGRNTSTLTSLFDWRTDQWLPVQRTYFGRWYPTSVTLPLGQVVSVSYNGERWDEGTGWTQLSGLDWTSAHNYPGFATPLHPFLLLAPNGRVAHFGPTRQFHYIDPTGLGARTAVDTQIPGEHFPKDGAWAMYDEGRALVSGGAILGQGTACARAYTVEMTASGIRYRAESDMAKSRAFHNAVVLPNGQVLMLGGSTAGIKFRDTGTVFEPELWDPTTRAWQTLAPADTPRNYHSVALLLPDGRVWSGGGGLGGSYHPNAEIFLPPPFFEADGSEAPRPLLTHAPEKIWPGQTFEVRGSENLVGFSLSRLSAVTHSINADQRLIRARSREESPGKYEVTVSANANVLTPGYWMLFGLNSRGLWSECKIIHVVPSAGPQLSFIPPQVTPTSQAISLQVQASHPKGTAVQFSARGLPDGIRIDPTTGVITGRTGGVPSSSSVTITASDGVLQAQRQFAWLVGQIPLTISVSPEQRAPQEQNRSITFAATMTGGTRPRLRWNFGDDTAETAWSSETTASHVFTKAGRFTVTLQAADELGQLATSQVLQVIHAPLVINQPPPPSSLIAYEKRSAATGVPDRLWVANPDHGSVSIMRLEVETALPSATLEKEVSVGAEPRGLAIIQTGAAAGVWVACAESNAVMKLSLEGERQTGINLAPGSRPNGIITSADKRSLFVACEGTGQLVEIDPVAGLVRRAISLAPSIRGITLSADGSAVFVSRFISPPVSGESDARPAPGAGHGEVFEVATGPWTVTRSIKLGSQTALDSLTSSRGIPNYLAAPAVSPDGLQIIIASKQDNIFRGQLRDSQPLTHDSTVRAVASRVVRSSLETPWPLEGDLRHRIDFDNASKPGATIIDLTGTLAFTTLESSREVVISQTWSGEILHRLRTDFAPQGIMLSPDESALFVSNYLSRSLSIFDVRDLKRTHAEAPRLIQTIPVTTSPEPLSPQVLKGKQLFHDSHDPRLALEGYLSCATCHDRGHHDGRVWDFSQFGEGLRSTQSLLGLGLRLDSAHSRLHWTGNADEVQDFENQIRVLAGGRGLMAEDAFTQTQAPLGAKKAGRSSDLDALAAYVASLRTLDRTARIAATGSILQGRLLFQRENCASCHGSEHFDTGASSGLQNIGTIRTGSGSRLGQALTGLRTPTLHGLRASSPYLHDGSAASVAEAIARHQQHSLTSIEREHVAAYLLALDPSDGHAPLPPVLPATTTASASTVQPGLKAEYFSGEAFHERREVRQDAALNFLWVGGSGPSAALPDDYFSARWSGWVTPLHSEDYTFFADVDDGIRIWIDDAPVLDHWNVRPDTYFGIRSQAVRMQAGRAHRITVEYQDYFSDAWIRLGWSSASQQAGNIPESALTSPTAGWTPSHGLMGEYFASASATLPPLERRIDPQINFLWSPGSPLRRWKESPPTDWRVRWTGWLLPRSVGTVTLGLLTSQRARLQIGDRVVIDQPKNVNGLAPLASGTFSFQNLNPHPIVLDYVHTGGVAQCEWTWSGQGWPSEIVPSEHLRWSLDGPQVSIPPVHQLSRTVSAAEWALDSTPAGQIRLKLSRTGATTAPWSLEAPVPAGTSSQWILQHSPNLKTWQSLQTQPAKSLYLHPQDSAETLTFPLSPPQTRENWWRLLQK